VGWLASPERTLEDLEEFLFHVGRDDLGFYSILQTYAAHLTLMQRVTTYNTPHDQDRIVEKFIRQMEDEDERRRQE
jgi:hypothetical protein